MSKSRVYLVLFVLLAVIGIGDAGTGGTFSAIIFGGFSICFLMLYAASVEDSMKHKAAPTYW